MKLKIVLSTYLILSAFVGGGARAEEISFAATRYCEANPGQAEQLAFENKYAGKLAKSEFHEHRSFINRMGQPQEEDFSISIKNKIITTSIHGITNGHSWVGEELFTSLSAGQTIVKLTGFQPNSSRVCGANIYFDSAPIPKPLDPAKIVTAEKQALDKSSADKNVQRNENKKIPVLIRKYCNQSPSVKEYTAFSFNMNGLFENDHFDFSKQFKNAQGLDQIEKYNLDLDSANKLRWKEYVLFQGNSPYNKTSEGRLKPNQTNIKLERVDDDGRVCGADITFDQAPIIDRPDPELEKVKNELVELKAQVEASKKKIDTTADTAAQSADDLKPLDDKVAKLNLSSDKLALQFDSYKQLQDGMKKDFEGKISLSIKNIETKITELSSAKDVNVDQIKKLQVDLADLKSKKLADDPTFQALAQKLAAAKKEAADNEASIKTQIEVNKLKLDAQRLSDMNAIDAKLARISGQIVDYQDKFDADLAAFQSGNNQRFAQITTNLDNLNARTAALEANQKILATNQTNLAVKQASTDARLEGIFLPESENPPDWISRLSSIPVQQNQFCRIVDRFHDDLAKVYKLRNDIKKNALYKDRQQDMAALLPNGAINSWVVRVVEVTQAADGSAAIMLQPPCRAMLGSDACGTDQKKFRATIQPETLMYRELARVNSGDFVTVSGTILYAQTMNTSSALPQYALYEPNKHCSAADGSKEEDVFVTEITNIAVLR